MRPADSELVESTEPGPSTREPSDVAPRLRVALDGTPLLGLRTGVGHLTAALIEALASSGHLDLVVYAITFRGRRSLAASVDQHAESAVRSMPARLVQECWRRSSFPRIEHWTGRVDVVHGTNYVGPPARAPVVISVHDLTFAYHAALAAPNHNLELISRALKRGATVHTISDYVAAQARDLFRLPDDRVVRIYPGLVTAGHGDARRGQARAGTDRYVLFLGELGPRKNVSRLVRAFDEVARDDPDLHLALVGPDGADTPRVEDAIARAQHGARVHRLGYVTGADRLDLLAGASVFAFPSLDEGFGFPPLEAMSAGVPVVAADAGALPEVLGDAALLVDPTDVGALAGAITTALEPVVAGELVARGRLRAARYRWDRTATELEALYRRLARPAATQLP
ncbi:MAG TPA: glycosyltransferase family 1 protein [Acidimicrobiia bacterium]|nr:glycosyltransferase family 1 protein [Acidimicrobiia bacterium]